MASEHAAWWYARSEGFKLGQIILVPTKVGLKEKRATHSALNNAYGTSVEVDYSAYTSVAGKTTGRQSMSLPVIGPCHLN